MLKKSAVAAPSHFIGTAAAQAHVMRKHRVSSPTPFLQVLSDRAEIAAAQAQLLVALKAEAEPVGPRSMRWKGGRDTRDVYWLRDVGLWMCFAETHNRHWNGFGLVDSTEVPKTLTPTVEINPPYEGINKAIAGAFARDNANGLYLVHRGKVGGGKKGVGKQAFLRGYRGALEKLGEDASVSECIVIGLVGDSDFAASLAAFVAQVHRFKHSHDVAHVEPSTSPTFSPEFEGTKLLGPREQILLNNRHGIVVNALQAQLTKEGYAVHNTQLIDLRIPLRSNAGVLFEVKSEADTYSTYTAVGQLFLHSMSKHDIKIVVLPSPLRPKIRSNLERLGIRVLVFAWQKDLPTFSELSTALKGVPKRGSA